MKAIVAVCRDWGIGLNNQLIVHNREDMHHFVRMTTSQAVVMGRKTLESFPQGRPLKDRLNIVLSSQAELLPKDVLALSSIEELLSKTADIDPDKLWLLGGAGLYKQLLPYCSEAIVTWHDCVKKADVFFHNLDEDPNWELSEVCPGGRTEEDIRFEFRNYRNLNPKTS